MRGEFIVAVRGSQGNRARRSGNKPRIFVSLNPVQRRRTRCPLLCACSDQNGRHGQSAGTAGGCYIRHVREPMGNSSTTIQPLPFWRVVLEHRKWFAVFTLAALALRLVFYFWFPHITGDSLIYGDIAHNWLDQGIFGLTHAEGVRPTWIRLPGYPAFLVRVSPCSDVSIITPCCWRRSSSTLRAVSSSPTWRGAPFRRGPPNSHLRWPHFVPLPRITPSRLWRRRSVSSLLRWRLTLRLPDSCSSTTAPSWKAWMVCGLAALGGNSASSRWRHSAGGDRTVLAMAHVAATAQRLQSVLGGNAAAGDFARAARSLDGSQLARLSPVRAALPTLCQRSRRVRSLRFRSLDAHLDHRLRLDRGSLLAGSGKRR